TGTVPVEATNLATVVGTDPFGVSPSRLGFLDAAVRRDRRRSRACGLDDGLPPRARGRARVLTRPCSVPPRQALRRRTDAPCGAGGAGLGRRCCRRTRPAP